MKAKKSKTVDPRQYSRLVVDGAKQSPSRAMLRAVGFQDADFQKPQIGVASTWANLTPCNMHINDLATEAVKGADDAGGKGVLFNTITVSDGISMGSPGMRYSLVSREVIADSIETVVGAEGFDGFDRIRDDLARDERIAHAGRAHRDAVRHGDRVEQHALAARGVHARDGLLRELVDVHVAGREVRPRRGDADLRLAEVRVFETHGPQHRPRGALLRAVHDQARMRARVDLAVLLLAAHLLVLIRLNPQAPVSVIASGSSRQKRPAPRASCSSSS